uniref:BRCA2 and CDKN1A-interacting protein n=1 Tax=Sus scrofa TaxID=9823 RepID=A0A8D1GXU5_PIG
MGLLLRAMRRRRRMKSRVRMKTMKTVTKARMKRTRSSMRDGCSSGNPVDGAPAPGERAAGTYCSGGAMEVNIEFEAYSISDNDYDGIKKLLQQLFLKAPVNTAELTDLLIQQNHIGSVIKQSVVSEDSDDDVDEDEIFGFISLLNLTERKGTPCAEQIKEWILRLCEKNCGKGLAEQLGRLLGDAARPVGFLLSERFVNVPPQIALPLHQQLQKELAEAHRTNKPCGKCHFYLLISKTFVEAGKSNSKKKWSDPKKEELMFANAEEEFFYEKALLKFSYPEYLLPWQRWLAFHLHSQIHRMLRWTWRAVGQEETPT